jgi:hypothetical protein
MTRQFPWLGLVVVVSGMCAVVSGQAIGGVITGPSLTNAVSGYPNVGLEITALQDSTLTSFTFQNQGQADTIELTNTSLSTVYDSTTTPAGNTSYTASVSWALTAGTTYLLVDSTMNNALFADYSAFPTSDAEISVVQGYFAPYFGPTTSYWGSFNNLTTTTASAVPEPSSLALGGIAGIVGLGVAMARRSRAA